MKTMQIPKELRPLLSFAEGSEQDTVVFTEKQAFEDYQVTGIPHVVLIDRAGKIRRVKPHYFDPNPKS